MPWIFYRKNREGGFKMFSHPWPTRCSTVAVILPQSQQSKHPTPVWIHGLQQRLMISVHLFLTSALQFDINFISWACGGFRTAATWLHCQPQLTGCSHQRKLPTHNASVYRHPSWRRVTATTWQYTQKVTCLSPFSSTLSENVVECCEKPAAAAAQTPQYAGALLVTSTR